MNITEKDRFNKICEGLSTALRKLNYSERSVHRHRLVWERYYAFKSPFSIDAESKDEFLFQRHGINKSNKVMSSYQIAVRIAMDEFLEYSQTGTIVKRGNPCLTNIPYPESLRIVAEQFIQSLQNRLHPKTIIRYICNLKRLTIYLDSQGIRDYKALKPENITVFISEISAYRERYIEDILSNLKKFFRYLYLNGYNDRDLSVFVPKANPRPAKGHLPTIWTKKDIEKVLSCIDISSPTGKRDYAMILIMARLGLRVGDITRLTFDNIKWNHNSIELIQLKTKTPLVLPLFEDVGNAIIDYINNGRPVTDSTVIFVKHQVPYTEFSGNNHLYGTLNKYLYHAGIAVPPDKSRGMHTLRHSMAVGLLQKDVPLPVISRILGHESIDSTSAYLRVDVEQLRQLTIGGEMNYAAQN